MLAVHASTNQATVAPMRLALNNGSTCSVAPSVVTPTSATHYDSLPKSLAVSCPIYGDFIISEAPLIELLLSEPIQRLKSVLQHGITGLIGLTPSPPVTRYAHSVGAMLLVRQAGGSLEAQASALLHDVAHTALSHVVDGAFGYVVHEEDKMEFLNKTEVPAILRRHFESAEDVLEEHNYPLLELDAPAVCADRLDYGIRDSYAFGFLTLEEARSIAKDLRVSSEGRFAFASAKWAKCLSVAYMKSDEYAWSNPRHGVLYEYAADTIKYAYSKGLLKKQDLWIGGDELFWKTMVRSPDSKIARLASRVTAQVEVTEVAENEVTESEETYSQTPKVRTIDPDVLLLDETSVEYKTLSQLDEDYHQQRQSYIKSKTGTKLYKVFYP